MNQKQIAEILKGYDLNKITIGVLGGHSALDVCSGAKKLGFRTLAVCQKGRDLTYSKYYKSRGAKGCIDEIVMVDSFADITDEKVQKRLRELNTIFIHNRYFWVYCDFEKIENDFKVPIFGSRDLVKLEERDHPNNQYVLLEKAGIRIPKIVRNGDSKVTGKKLVEALDKHFVGDKGGPLIVKVNEAERSYERAFFVVTNTQDFLDVSKEMIESGKILAKDLDRAVIEEFIIGAQINFNYFYSPISKELELMGTDTRRQTSLDGFLRLDAATQMRLIDGGYKPTMVETGHIACTTKESILEKAFEAGEKFIKTIEKEAGGIIGPFALQGAIASYSGKEEFVVFDVSMRIPGSPGTRFTPLSGYLYGESISYGERIAMEIRQAIEGNDLLDVLS